MIANGEIQTSTTAVYTVKPNSNGVTVTMVRIVNESGAERTFTIWLNVNGTDRAITPIDTQLPIGSCFDDLPVFQLSENSKVMMVASDTGVSWTINAVQL